MRSITDTRGMDQLFFNFARVGRQYLIYEKEKRVHTIKQLYSEVENKRKKKRHQGEQGCLFKSEGR